jgi:hypothetical protein
MSLEMKYFVLKPRGDNIFAKASRAAMRTYAKVIWEHDYDFAKSLEIWADSSVPESETPDAGNNN